jgi:hypothetical protein
MAVLPLVSTVLTTSLVLNMTAICDDLTTPLDGTTQSGGGTTMLPQALDDLRLARPEG